MELNLGLPIDNSELNKQIGLNWRWGKINDIDKYFPHSQGEMMKEIYDTASKLFPTIPQLQPDMIKVIFSETAGTFSGGASADPNQANLALGAGELASKNIIQRAALRMFGSIDENDSDNDKVYVPLFAMAHEMGHIIQGSPEDGSDKLFVDIFGNDINRNESYLENEYDYSDDEYTRYIQSDGETNADFIALIILSNWEPELVGNPKSAGYEMSDWKKWADDHKIYINGGRLSLV